MRDVTSSQNLELIKEELDDALFDCANAPSYLIVEIVMNVLDAAEIQGRLRPRERLAACNYLSERYGYNF